MVEKRTHSNFETHRAGRDAVAGELSSRGYRVELAPRKRPAVDLLCRSSGGVEFSVKVKCLTSKTSWLFGKSVREPRDRLFFVLVLLPASPLDPTEYYILSHSQLLDALDEQDRANKEAGDERGEPLADFPTSVYYKVVKKLTERFGRLDGWDKLPQ
jgi:hypothetical protein